MTSSIDLVSEQNKVFGVHRRTLWVLIVGQILSGIGFGATVAAGALLVTQVSGSEALSGMATTMLTVGAALAAVPLASLASRYGRAPSLATGAALSGFGALVGLGATVQGSTWLLFVGFVLVGVGTAVNLQARFAATDLSQPNRESRDLAMVVWPTTIGAVLGPNLIQPADTLGISLGLPELSGPFLFTFLAQAAATVIYLLGLRPDPLRLATRLGLAHSIQDSPEKETDSNGVITGIVALSLTHAVMTAIMAMTPVHLVNHGASYAVVGLTISLHVLGMYGLSPLWGWLSDRFGRELTVALGQLILLTALFLLAAFAESEKLVTVGLVLIGVGWSAGMVAGSALISASVGVRLRARTQGRADLLMSTVGALGGATSGLVLSSLGYGGLALVSTALAGVVLLALVIRQVRGVSALK